MILDSQLQLAKAQAISATANSTNVVDLFPAFGSQKRNLGDGEPMGLLIDVDVSADFTTGDESYSFALVTADNTALTTNAVTVLTIAPGSAKLLAGKRFVAVLPPGQAFQEFLGIIATLGGTTPSVTYTAYLQPLSMIEKLATYLDNSNIG